VIHPSLRKITFKASPRQKAGASPPPYADKVTPIFESIAAGDSTFNKHLDPPINNANQAENNNFALQLDNISFSNLDD